MGRLINTTSMAIDQTSPSTTEPGEIEIEEIESLTRTYLDLFRCIPARRHEGVNRTPSRTCESKPHIVSTELS
jgi:hypothetical protein